MTTATLPATDAAPNGDETAALEDSLQEARDRFYPSWWAYVPTLSNGSKPLYHVVCRSAEEWELARAAKPDFVDAELVLVRDGEL